MPEITRPTVRLSLLVTPPADAARDDLTLAGRIAHFEKKLAEMRQLALTWASTRSASDKFEDFETRMIEAARQAACAGAEVTLACADAKDRRERPSRFTIGETEYRMSAPEPRSYMTWWGVVRYSRSYARPVDGGVGHCPLDFELGLFGDRISPTLLLAGARLATRMSFAEAREVLGWFVPEAPSTEVLEQTVLGLGSAYEADGRRPRSDDPGGAPWQFASEVAAALTPPEPVYVLDVALAEDQLRLVELNPFSGADLYACDPAAVVDAVALVAERIAAG